MRRPVSTLLAPLALLGMVLLLAGCGRKGPVRPLEPHLPDAARNVTLSQRGDALLLSWQLPLRHQDGTPLTDPPLMEIYRLSFAADDFCAECADRAPLLFSIPPDLPAPARLVDDRYQFSDDKVVSGQGYLYRLLPRSASGVAGRPVDVRMVMAPPLEAPTGLQADARDRFVALSWPPAAVPPGYQLLGYRLYRSGADDTLPAQPLNRRPLVETTYDDAAVENGRTYRYQLRSVLGRAGQIFESLAGTSVAARPVAEP